VAFEQYNANAAPGNAPNSEIELRGTKGTMYIRSSNWEVVPEKIADFPTGYAGGKGYGTPLSRGTGAALNASMKTVIEPRKAGAPGASDTTLHARNFLDCIKSRGKCNADIVTGHLSTSATLLGNIAHKTRSMLEWDAKAERFTNNTAANRLLSYQYRAPYKLG